MPKKKRKSVNVNRAPDIPYTKVRVEWIDCISDSSWATDKEFDKMKLATPVNEGWLYSKDKISLPQKGKMVSNLADLQMMTSKEKKFFKKLNKDQL